MRQLQAEVTDLTEQLKAERAPAPTAVVREVFDFWREATGHKSAKLNRVRTQKIRARMREGYTTEDLKCAVRGAAEKPTVVDGRTYDDLELICRNGAKVEDFMSRVARMPHTEQWETWCEANVPELPVMYAAVVAERLSLGRYTLTPHLVREQFALSRYASIEP